MKKVITNFIVFFILTIRPLLGPDGSCKHLITCTEYAKEQFEEEKFLKALFNILLRVLFCNPLIPKSWYKKLK